MARYHPYVPAPAFHDARAFDEQLYRALRKSPWWMISVAVHVMLFVVSGLLAQDLPAYDSTRVAEIHLDEAAIPPEEKPADDPVEVERLRREDLVATEPQVIDQPEEAERPETDNDLPYDEVYGNTDGPGAGDFEGIANNSVIGIGGGLAFGGRGRGGDRNAGRRGGPPGGRQDEAVEHALRWLAAHQSADGRWEAEGFGRWCDGRQVASGPDGAGRARYDAGVTGLSLLAFLGAGYTHRSEGPFGKTVGMGLRWLRNQQDAEGCFAVRASQHYVYDHAIASLAMVEAYGMTGSAMYRGPAQRALDFIAIARNPYLGWRYGVKPGENDTSVTGWMMMALKSAQMIVKAEARAGRPPSLQIDEEAFDGIRTWIDKMTDPDSGRVGYQARGSGPARTQENLDLFPAEKSESMTAVGVLARVFLGEDPRSSAPVAKGAALMAQRLPRWDRADGSIDFYYWYYATLAMFQVGGEGWRAWQAAMRPAILDTQRMDGDYCGYKGSWDPVDPWSADGGRVYATATLAMCLEVWYRYDRVFGTR